MDYKIVNLDKKKVAGLKIRTSNGSPDAGEKIGGLWQRFFSEGVYEEIPGKTKEATIGLYTNYAGDEKGEYDMYVCCEVDPDEKLSEQLDVTEIEAGKYAKFVVKGHMVTAVQDFWQKLWDMKLERKFSCDFEEYQPMTEENMDMEHCEIHMYISLL